MVMGGGIKIMAGHGSSCLLVMDAHGWSHHLVMPPPKKKINKNLAENMKLDEIYSVAMPV